MPLPQFSAKLCIVVLLSDFLLFCYFLLLLLLLDTQLLCLYPSEAVCWLSLLVAAAVSSVFLVRSLGPMVMQQQQARQQAAVLLAAVG